MSKEVLEIAHEASKAFFCGSCNQGLDSFEEYQSHQHDEQHKFHIERKIGSMVPGLAYCQACACVVQTTTAWTYHIGKGKHAKCIESRTAIGKVADFETPLGCITPGELGGPIDPSEIDLNKVNSYGYSTNLPGAVIIGLEHVKRINTPTNAMKFRCEVCNEDFNIGVKDAHFKCKQHRVACLKRFYPEWAAKLPPDNLTVRYKFSVLFFGSKAEEIEKETECEEAKKLRVEFEEADNKLRSRPRPPKSKRTNRSVRGRDDKKPSSAGGYPSRRDRADPPRGPPPNQRDRGHPRFREPTFIDHHRGLSFRGNRSPPRGPPSFDQHHRSPPRGPPSFDQHHRSPPRGPPSFDQHHRHDDYRSPPFGFGPNNGGGRGHSYGEKRGWHDERYSEPKRHREDRYSGDFNQYNQSIRERGNDAQHSEALEAIEVLERYAMNQAQQEIKRKISRMKDAVKSGGNPVDVEGYSEMLSQVQKGSKSTGPPAYNNTADFSSTGSTRHPTSGPSGMGSSNFMLQEDMNSGHDHGRQNRQW